MLSKRFILLMCVIVLSCFASHSWAASGSASDPYIISTANDLAALRDRVNSGTETNGLYYKLSKNISLAKSYTDWEPIGTSTFPFSGHFDGNGFTITVNIDRGEEEAVDGMCTLDRALAAKVGYTLLGDDDVDIVL